MKTTTRLELPVTFDSFRTDAESLCAAFDQLLETALSTPGILDEYGPVEIGAFGIADEKPTLAVEVYRHVVGGVESLEQDDRVGADLAYLLGALLQSTVCSWPSSRRIVQILQRLGKKHAVWRFITIEKTS